MVECNSELGYNVPKSVTFDGLDCSEQYNVTVYIKSESDVILPMLCSTNNSNVPSNISLPCAGK